ncbi:MAG: FtsW/RodA/SpoVE family cell cycle protein [Oscillospiraceae bacterium]|nr:FtsW/RodA/SpoVE family cell cycle protein [Oscillospiraceae bacterium]
MNRLKQIIAETDLVFIAICATCSGLSVFSMYSIFKHMSLMETVRPVIVQLGASVIGIVAAFIISFVDYKELCRLYKAHMTVAIGLMVLCMFIGFAPQGTTNKAWIALPFGLSLQPSEVLKISTILTLSHFFEKYKYNINEVKILVKLIGIALIPVAFVLIQKDDGTLLVYLVMIACMFFAAGVSPRLIGAAVAACVAALPVLWFGNILDEYQKSRILALFNPDEYASVMWQQNMGRISIGSGRIIGKGFLVDTHNNTPLAYNDFIFSFIAESMGFVGTVLVLLLIVFLWLKILLIARRSADVSGSLICVGVFGMMMAQTVINIGMNLSLMPVIGITLPLFSAGGTSVVVIYCAIGLVLSVARHNPKALFDGGL